METLRRRGVLKRIGLATLGVVGSPALDACGVLPPQRVPTSTVSRSENGQDIDAEIQQWQVTLDEARRNNFADCAVKDVNQELQALAAGVDTYVPRPIDPTIDADARRTILDARTSLRVDLQKRARQILTLTQDKDTGTRALYLGTDYGNLGQIEADGAKTLSNNDDMGKELIYLSLCHYTKSLTLTLPYNIEKLKQQRGKQ